jgi:hypothetical protein
MTEALYTSRRSEAEPFSLTALEMQLVRVWLPQWRSSGVFAMEAFAEWLARTRAGREIQPDSLVFPLLQAVQTLAVAMVVPSVGWLASAILGVAQQSLLDALGKKVVLAE